MGNIPKKGTRMPIVRRPHVDYRHYVDTGDYERFYFDNNSVVTQLWNLFSALATPTEAFFIRNVNKVKDQITDPLLKKQVEQFVRQEANHSAEHHRANQILEEFGYPVAYGQKLMAKAMDKIEGSQLRLAVTACGEHFLGELGYMMLEEGYADKMTEPQRTLAKWHAYEEYEHKSVAMDLYYHLYGKNLSSYLVRIKALFVMMITLGLPSFKTMGAFLKVDHKGQRIKVLYKLFVFNFLKPAFAVRLGLKAIPYLSFSYHPDKTKNIQVYLDKYRYLMDEKWVVENQNTSSEEIFAKAGL